MLRDSLLGLIRTVTPAAVATLTAWLAARGLDLDTETSAALTVAITGILVASYYAVAAWLERRVHPAFGWLLGAPTAPAYPAAGTGGGGRDDRPEAP